MIYLKCRKRKTYDAGYSIQKGYHSKLKKRKRTSQISKKKKKKKKKKNPSIIKQPYRKC